MRHLTDKENECVLHLAIAWNSFLDLKDDSTGIGICDDDLDDFRKSIHDAQRIVLSRPSLGDV